MRVHHLNCATMCPLAGSLLLPGGQLVAHCLLVEAPNGLVLVDTGFGMAECTGAHRLPGAFRALTGPRLDPNETAIARVRALGFEPRDVRDIVVTHLDLDHAGGLADFPWARVHVHATEHRAATERATLAESQRYLAPQWAHGPAWVKHERTGERWRGFDAVRAMEGLPPELLLVPLHGHSRGHSCVAIESDAGWLLHAGDAYFHRGAIHAGPPVPATLRVFETVVAFDGAQMRRNQARLRTLASSPGAPRIVCAHDPDELAQAQLQSTVR